MIRVLPLILAAILMAGCDSGPTDAGQQKLAEEFSSENVAKEMEKAGKTKEAEELRRAAQSQEN